jgi:hypothetical protein
MKVMESSVRPDITESEFFLGSSSPEHVEKRHLKEIVMNGEISESPSVELKAPSSEVEEPKVTTTDSDCENVTSTKTNGHADIEKDATPIVESAEKPEESTVNGDTNGIPEEGPVTNSNAELPSQEVSNGEVENSDTAEKKDEEVAQEIADKSSEKNIEENKESVPECVESSTENLENGIENMETEAAEDTKADTPEEADTSVEMAEPVNEKADTDDKIINDDEKTSKNAKTDENEAECAPQEVQSE